MCALRILGTPYLIAWYAAFRRGLASGQGAAREALKLPRQSLAPRRHLGALGGNPASAPLHLRPAYLPITSLIFFRILSGEGMCSASRVAAIGGGTS